MAHSLRWLVKLQENCEGPAKDIILVLAKLNSYCSPNNSFTENQYLLA
jgi:hypothetical protein